MKSLIIRNNIILYQANISHAIVNFKEERLAEEARWAEYDRRVEEARLAMEAWEREDERLQKQRDRLKYLMPILPADVKRKLASPPKPAPPPPPPVSREAKRPKKVYDASRKKQRNKHRIKKKENHGSN